MAPSLLLVLLAVHCAFALDTAIPPILPSGPSLGARVIVSSPGAAPPAPPGSPGSSAQGPNPAAGQPPIANSGAPPNRQPAGPSQTVPQPPPQPQPQGPGQNVVLSAVHGDGKCGQDGQFIRAGSVYFRCSNGSMIADACSSDEGGRVPVGQRFQTTSFELECKRAPNDPNALRLVPAACVHLGRRVEPGSTFQTTGGGFYFTCVPRGDGVIVELTGCVDQDNRLIEAAPAGPVDPKAVLDESKLIKRGDFVFQCVRTENGGVGYRPLACIGDDGRRYKIGEDIAPPVETLNSTGFSYFYRCVERKGSGGSTVVKELAGCIVDGRRVAAGQKAPFGGFVYECRKETDGIRYVIVGCLDRNDKNDPNVTQRQVGERWTEGQAPYRYVVECVKENDITTKRIAQCFYDDDKTGNKASLEANCMKKLGTVLVQCASNAGNGVQFRVTADATDVHINAALQAGFKLC